MFKVNSKIFGGNQEDLKEETRLSEEEVSDIAKKIGADEECFRHISRKHLI